MIKVILSLMLVGCLTSCSQSSPSQTTETSQSEITVNNDAATADDTADLTAVRVEEVDPDVRARFETLHNAWYEAAGNDPEIKMSSSTYAMCKLPQFDEMVSMGDAIIPLLMEKMSDEKYFFTQTVYEAIDTTAMARLAKALDRDVTTMSAQDKAKEYVKLYN